MEHLLGKHWQVIYQNAKEAGETKGSISFVITPAENKFEVDISYVRQINQSKTMPIDDGERQLPGIEQ